MTKSPAITPELLTAVQAAEYLGIGQRTLARWSAEGKAPAPVKLTPGRRGALRYRRADLETWVSARCPDLREEQPEPMSLIEAMLKGGTQ